MLLLAVDTSSAVSAALYDGRQVVAERTTYDPRRHVELLTPTIDQVFQDAGVSRRDITGLVAATGPGPFTGLRVGLVTARTMALALGVDVVGVCSLDALALQAARYLGSGASEIVAATDARRREVYWARYRLEASPDGDDGGPDRHVPVRVEGPEVGKAADIPVDGAICVGRGAVLYPDALPGPGDDAPLDPCAGALAEVAASAMAAGVTLGAPEPLYLRRPDAAVPKAPKKVGR